MNLNESQEQHERMLCAWHLSILRFAVTRHDTDRLNVLAIAQELDRFDGRHDSKFRFFRRTSARLCLAVLDDGEPAQEILRRYLAEIAEIRLRQAFAAACRLEQSVSPADRALNKTQDLFRGLTSRKVRA